MAPSTNPLVRFGAALLRIFRIFRSIILNLIFLFVVVAIIAALIGQPPLVVPQGAALVLNPVGVIVEQQSATDAVDTLLNQTASVEGSGEILLQDLLDVIALAAEDDRISAIVLDMDKLQGAALSHLQDVGAALKAFREHDKRVYALGSNFSQGQYYLASYADEIMLNSFGAVDIEGLSAWQNYYGEAISKLGINVHVFRVGEYKSAVEPFTRSDMSPEAKSNYTRLLGDLWEDYVTDINTNRNLQPGVLENLINHQDEQLAAYEGDSATLALQNGLVDRVESPADSKAYLLGRIGANRNSLNAVDYQPYLRSQRQQLTAAGSEARIGIIVAKGDIVDGEAPRGAIGGDSLSALIQQASDDRSISALVLRIDSGGGSAFASEIIRSALQGFTATGRPLVVSMGSVAASGGYWIATPATQIWASPSTITGSIGIFGLYPTFEDTFSKLGIGTDGVGTTDLAGYTTPGRPLEPLAARSLQLTVEHGYKRFISLVADSRNMSLDAVDAIAQGQVWSGKTALELGLVDSMGSLDAATASAAELAGLENYTTKLIEAPLSPAEQLLQEFANSVHTGSALGSLIQVLHQPSVAEQLLGRFKGQLATLLHLNDPNAMYLQCLECSSLHF